MTHGEDMCCTVGETAVDKRSGQEDEAGKDGDPMQLAERASDHVPCEMRAWQNLKRRGREHKSEKHQTTDPDDEREQHEETQEGHDGEIIVGGGATRVNRRGRQETRRERRESTTVTALNRDGNILNDFFEHLIRLLGLFQRRSI